MKYVWVMVCALAIAACTQQKPAEVVYRGNYFFGRDGAVDTHGNYLPKYSADNPAPLNEYDSAKYQAPTQQQYSAAASVDSVNSTDLPAPNASSAPEPLTPLDTSSTASAPPAVNNSYASLPQQHSAPVHVPPPQTFVSPLKGKVISTFAQNGKGINIEARAGEPIRAAADGVVIYADHTIKEYGNMIVLQHGGGWVTSYAHAGDIVVQRGDNVVQGQLIGFVGKTGNVTTPQLHFSMRKDESAVDPQSYLK